VERLDFVTSAGFLHGGDARECAGLRGRGPAAVITDLCVLEPDPDSRELMVTSIHPGVTREQIVEATGWPIRFAADAAPTEPPSQDVLEVLRDLQARTRRAHGEAA
jgi:glutaconate CoA-transferase subunit B